MQNALNDQGFKIKAYPSGRAICQGCGSILIAKCGEMNIWHWAHENGADCDSWHYEPKTEWHIKWQNYFNESEREVSIVKNNQHHIADIFNKNEIVIEIQNSPISTYDIKEREKFYDKMIWIINSKEFIHNIILKDFLYDLSKDTWFKWIFQYPNSEQKAFAIIIPDDDFNNRIKPALINCKYEKAYDEEKDTEFWYNQRTQYQQSLENEILSAFSSYLLDSKMVSKLDETKMYSTNFKWLHARKSWIISTKPLFIDLNNGFLFFVKTFYENGNGFGKLVHIRKFLNKYK